ncbi:uncharacterized protein LOC124278439, partial [Haliotis rubra]|uniref:uncharacterized protein LOC124278439 n=1 Tax=Haliotis rubra TaxID=36100 RepID=UPI001EE545D6
EHDERRQSITTSGWFRLQWMDEALMWNVSDFNNIKNMTLSLVFALPAEYGDKVGLSMTVLLSFGVFLTQMTNNMPKTSRQTSYLTIYLTILLTLSSIHVVMSVVILRMHSSLVFALPAEYGDKVGLSMTVLLSFGVFLTQMTNNMPKTSRQTSYLTIYLIILLTLSSIHVRLDLHVHENHIDDVITKKCTDDATWKDVSSMLDAMCLRAFFFINITCGVIFFTILTRA